MSHPPRPLLSLLILTAAILGASGRAGASVPITGSAIHTSAAEVERLSDPEVVASAKEPEGPVPAPTLETPSLPPVHASAKNTDIEVTDTSAYPNRVHGRIIVEFNNDVNQTYSCSGTMINSVQRNVVFTAGHCVYDNDTLAYPSALIFMPGYLNGQKPYGELAAVAVNSPVGWVNNEDFKYDMGAVQLAGTPEDQVGSRGIAFDLNPYNRSFHIYGYPAEPEPTYDGERLIRCDARMQGRDGPGALAPIAAGPCYMRQGASGGGWVTDGRYVNSLTSYVYCDPGDSTPAACGLDFGPYFSSAARSLYESVADTVTPTVKFIKSPPKATTKRRLVVLDGGTGTTPLTSFSCRLDGQPWTRCFPATEIRRLSVGKHRLSVRSIDQTGHESATTVTRSFRVKRARR